MRLRIATSSAVYIIQHIWKERVRQIIITSSAVYVIQLVWKERVRLRIAASSAVLYIQSQKGFQLGSDQETCDTDYFICNEPSPINLQMND